MDGFNRRPQGSNLYVSRQPAPVFVTIDNGTTTSLPPPMPEPIQPSPAGKSPKKPGKFKFKLPIPKTKLQWVLFGLIVFVLLTGSASAIYWFIFRDNSPPPVVVQQEPEPEPEPEPTTGPSVVSGREVPLSQVKKPIYAVQIENSPEARPQSGLVDADIVSEAVAEGGITRFNAIYHDNVPANIGPVRSLRPYYIDWFLPYKAGIVHAGGSADALRDIDELNLQDMNHNSSSFRRVSNRYAPHNLYTTGQQMLDLFVSKNFTNGDTIPSLPRKKAEPAETATAGTINIAFSRALYNVSFTWDKASGSYLRSMGGSPHLDADTKQRIAPNVIVAPVLTKGLHSDRVHTTYETRGSGKVFIFQDGHMFEGTWSKPARSAQWEFKNAAGEVIKLNPGQTWFTIIDSPGAVSHSP